VFLFVSRFDVDGSLHLRRAFTRRRVLRCWRCFRV
jgi:hypothetical protein